MKFPNFKLSILLSFLMIIFSAAGCKKEQVQLLSLNQSKITLKPGQTFNLVVSPDSAGCLFTSENNNIAEVFASGLIQAHLVGVTNIIVTNTDKGFRANCKVTVTPEYEMYREPYLSFGVPKSTIKSYETRQMADENDSTIIYTGENSYIDSLSYSFENSAYSSSICIIPTNSQSLLINYLSERYVYLGYIDINIIGRLTTDGKTYVVTQFYSSSDILVYYFPKKATKNGTGLLINSELSEAKNYIKSKLKGL